MVAPGYGYPPTAPGYPQQLAVPGYPQPLAAPGYPLPLAAPGYPQQLTAPGYPQQLAAPGYPQPLAAPGYTGAFGPGYGHAAPPYAHFPPGYATAGYQQGPCGSSCLARSEDRRPRSEDRAARERSGWCESPERRERRWLDRPLGQAPPGCTWVRGREWTWVRGRATQPGERPSVRDSWEAVCTRDIDDQQRAPRSVSITTSRRGQEDSQGRPARGRQGAAEDAGDGPARRGIRQRRARAEAAAARARGGDATANETAAGVQRTATAVGCEGDSAAGDGAANAADRAAQARKDYKRAKRAAAKAAAKAARALCGEAGTDANTKGAPSVADAAATDTGSVTITGLTLRREVDGTTVTIAGAQGGADAVERQVFRPGNPTPSEDESSDAALPVGGEPEQADDGMYDGLDEPEPAAERLPNDLGGMFDDDPDDLATEREAAAVGREGAADARNRACKRGRTDVRERVQFRMPAPPGPDGFAPSFFPADKPLVSRAAAAAERAAEREQGDGPVTGLRSRAGRLATKTPEPHGSGTEGPATEDEGGAPRRRGPVPERSPIRSVGVPERPPIRAVGTDLEDISNRERMLSGQNYRIPLKRPRPLALSAEGDQRVAVIASIQRIRKAVMERGEYGEIGELGYGPVSPSKLRPSQLGIYVLCPLSDAHGATMGLHEREKRRFKEPGADAPEEIFASGRAIAGASDEAPYWSAIGFTEVKQASDESFYLRVCSPKPDWDDDVVDTLAGSTDVSKDNRGGVSALGAVARRNLTAGMYLGEPTREEAAAQRREAERESQANRRKGKGKGNNTGKGKGKGKGRGGRGWQG